LLLRATLKTLAICEFLRQDAFVWLGRGFALSQNMERDLMEAPSDSELICQAQGGDRDAFEQLYWRYQNRVLAAAYGVVRNRQDAMDIAQESFVRVYKNLHKFQADSSFYTWLYRIVVNLSIDHLRRRKKHKEVEFDNEFQKNFSDDDPLLPSTLGINPGKVYQRKELREQLNLALESLSEKHRSIIILREIEGLSYNEISEALGISMGTVMSRLHHARLNMQAALREYLDADGISPTQK